MGSIIAFPEPPEHPRFIEKNDGWYFVENDRYEDKIENLLAGRCETNLDELEAQDMIHCAAAAYLKKANIEAAGIVRGRADCLRKALDWLALLEG